MAYAESESMALKRLKVALKRKDWQMFEYGLSRTLDLLNSGTKISEIQEWYKILDSAKAEKIPEEQKQKLSSIIESILSPTGSPVTQSDSGTITTDTPAYKQKQISPQISLVKAADIPFILYINSIITPEQANAVRKIRHCLDKISVDPDSKIDSDFLPTLTNLLSSLKPNLQELNGLEDFLKSYKDSGVIITTGYDSEIINILERNELNYSIEGIKKCTAEKHWKIYTLGGLSSIYWCPKCGTHSFYINNEHAAVAVCSKCSQPAYPDLQIIDSYNPQVNPKLWYKSYQALTNSANWLLISPPNASEKEPISQLVLEACHHSIIQNAYIVSNKSEIGTWWRNKLEETNTNANVAPVCFNVEILFNNYIKLPENQSNN